MGIDQRYDAPEGWHAALAALAWQVDLGVCDVILDDPINRYDLVEAAAAVAQVAAAAAPVAVPVVASAEAAVAVAEAAAGGARSLDELRLAVAAFEHCEIKQGARSLVFGDGNPAARVLILGEAPGPEDDREGRPFVGPAGQLLDKMFAAIGLSRGAEDAGEAIYLTNVMPWRTPQGRDPSEDEIAMMRPFVERHIALINPEVIVLMGNTPCHALLGQRGILKLRGVWAQALGKPALPMLHPVDLLRKPILKREAWADLLAIKGRLE